ncbi:MAG: CYTH domain-containing protein [Urechidicola sp.]|nr:CYTH domain-containing protein [Urechidicola sp.]
MSKEIERKFLIKGNFKSLVIKKNRIVQGYLSLVPERAVRVRIKGDLGFITIKGISNESGVSRYEWEKEIPLNEAKELLAICEPGVIDKTRFIVKADGNLVFEVDEFYGDNEGLIIAEIELPTEDAIFTKPSWLGEEVTGNEKYYNASLIKKPFKSW